MSDGGNGLEEKDIRRAIRHLAKLGDSDIVPSLPEYIFFEENVDQITKLCSTLTVGSFKAKSAIELLSPKSEFGFRIAHQLTAFDNLIYLSSALSCARALEPNRADREGARAFSYRYVDTDEPLIFSSYATFHNWLEWNRDKVGLKSRIAGIKWVAVTDISDFYHRINFHRIENALDDYGCGLKPRSFALKLIKKIRADQSFGLPVGASASRIISEGVLIDTDRFIESQGWDATRFVDDIRMFFKEKTDAQTALGRLAQHLMVTEGLSLNSSKTKIVSVREYSSEVRKLMEDVFSKDESAELDHLFKISYSQEVESDEQGHDSSITCEDIIDKLRSFLEEAKDISQIRVILRALRVYQIDDVQSFLDEFAELFMIVPRDMSLAIWASLAQNGWLMSSTEETSLRQTLTQLVETSPYQEMAIVRVWILELFARGLLDASPELVEAAERPDLTALERRQLLLIRGRLADKGYFRALKTKFSELNDWERPVAMWAASCLPADEYEKWIKFAKALLDEPYADVYAAWLIKNHGKLFDKLGGVLEAEVVD